MSPYLETHDFIVFIVSPSLADELAQCGWWTDPGDLGKEACVGAGLGWLQQVEL